MVQTCPNTSNTQTEVRAELQEWESPEELLLFDVPEISAELKPK